MRLIPRSFSLTFPITVQYCHFYLKHVIKNCCVVGRSTFRGVRTSLGPRQKCDSHINNKSNNVYFQSRTVWIFLRRRFRKLTCWKTVTLIINSLSKYLQTNHLDQIICPRLFNNRTVVWISWELLIVNNEIACANWKPSKNELTSNCSISSASAQPSTLLAVVVRELHLVLLETVRLAVCLYPMWSTSLLLCYSLLLLSVRIDYTCTVLWSLYTNTTDVRRSTRYTVAIASASGLLRLEYLLSFMDCLAVSQCCPSSYLTCAITARKSMTYSIETPPAVHVAYGKLHVQAPCVVFSF